MRLSELSADDLRQLLRAPDPHALLRGSAEPPARAAYLIRAHLLERMAAALTAARAAARLVKGAALALTHYPAPWVREMSDIDLLVRPGDEARVVDALERAGLDRDEGDRTRPRTAALFGEIAMNADVAGAPLLVEVHTGLDKVVARPVDHAAIFARARPAPGLAGLLVPEDADHVLLVVLHEASSEFRHLLGFLDLHLLLRGSPDVGAIRRRAREWALGSALYVALAGLSALGAGSVPLELLDELEPGALRRTALARYYDVGRFPLARAPQRLGWPWMLRQTPLRDDLGAWCLGLARYAGLRALERLQTAHRPSGR